MGIRTMGASCPWNLLTSPTLALPSKLERTRYLDLFSQHLFGQAEYSPDTEKLEKNGMFYRDKVKCKQLKTYKW